MEKDYQWPKYYMEFADKLTSFRNNRSALLQIIKRVIITAAVSDLPNDDGEFWTDVDPFTVFGMFSRGLTPENKKKILVQFKNELNIVSDVPQSFNGVPELSNVKTWFFGYKKDRNEKDIDNLWDLFICALDYDKTQNEETKDAFIDKYNIVIGQKQVSWNITMGLFWMRPYRFVSLDYSGREMISSDFVSFSLNKKDTNKKFFSKGKPPSGKDYLEIVALCSQELNSHSFANFVELSESAYKKSKEQKKNDAESIPEYDALNPLIEAMEENTKNEDVLASENKYTVEDFLEEVFITRERYNDLKSLLLRKKNVILQGPPGVGKTFMAKRLAYSITGKKDPERVQSVQFHQNYSYEDFVCGYKPDGEGFKIKKGPFYEFCKKAEKDLKNKYFLIIDEINRGNLSKIFGELLVLIEEDKRNQKLPILYLNEEFAVPGNVYIIGMMNTADRSLAMMDYALRRRFGFFTITPAFNSNGFQETIKKQRLAKFNEMISAINELNEEITRDDSLGKGFLIGHSYFCHEGDEDLTDEWLKEIVSYEIVPLLQEYWFDNPSKSEEWESRLNKIFQQ